MNSYIIKGSNFEVTFTYSPSGKLLGIISDEAMDPGIWAKLLNNDPWTEESLMIWKSKFRNIKIEQLIVEPTFEVFWTKYGNKKDRIKAEAVWKRLTEIEKHKAIQGVRKYRQSCESSNIAMLYPERYLKNKRWEDEN